MNTELNKFMVNDHEYKYRGLNPFDALDFGSRVAKLLAPALASGMNVGEALVNASKSVDSKEIASLLKEALGYCYTPEKEALDNEATFNKWFNEHPDELFEAGIKAVYSLVNPFLPRVINTVIGQQSLAIKQ